MAKKLTARQLAVLAQLAEPNAEAHYMPYMGRFNAHAYWFVSGGGPRVTREVEALISAGLLTKGGNYHKARATINTAGRAYLKQNKPEKSKTETWWKWGYGSLMSEEFASSTDATLIQLNGRKKSKSTNWEAWYPSREAAMEARRIELESAVKHAEARLKGAREELDNFKVLCGKEANG